MTLEQFISISKKTPQTVKKWIRSGWVNGAFYIDGKYYISDLARPPYTRVNTKSSASIRKGIVIACKRRLSVNAKVLNISEYEFDLYIDQLIANGLIEKRIVDNVTYYYATMKADNMSDNKVYTTMKEENISDSKVYTMRNHSIEEKKTDTNNQNNNPIVFISYSWTDEEHKNMVLHLAEKMRHDGIDVILDQWDLKPGYDKYVFMEQSINKADKVLIICDQQYAIKADDRKGGVGTETAIITPSVYNSSDQSKFIPVITDNFEVVPTYLKSRLGVNYRPEHREEGYIELLRLIYDNPLNKKPELGKAPEWINQIEYKDKKND